MRKARKVKTGNDVMMMSYFWRFTNEAVVVAAWFGCLSVSTNGTSGHVRMEYGE